MPVMAPVWSSQTEKGIRYLSYTILLFLLAGVIGILMIAALAPVLAALAGAAQTGTIDPSILGALGGFLAAACGLFIVSLVGLIMGLIGLLALHKGGVEFGPEHAKRIDHGIIVLIIGILVPLIGGVAVSAAAIGSGLGVPGSSLTIPTLNPGAIAGSIALGAFQAILVGLFLIWSVERLVDPPAFRRAYLALALGIAGSVAGGSVSLTLLVMGSFPIRLEDLAALIVVESLLSQGFSIPSLALWYSVYSGVLRRFRQRELQPAPPGWIYPPPMYYPAAPYTPPPAPPSPPPGEPPKT